ncbi:MAG: TonB-dependent receptor [Prolixibacteraceae bacterium]|nr:TonB-dependent receptor [Prolixibacteraceae bacterium]MBT7393773.1 TonB-dependent receptor [Prolixibacteraceae bacterium]
MKKSRVKYKAQQILSFKKWGRKSYSLFLTLNRTVKISVLLVIYLLSSPAVSLANMIDTSDVKMQFDLDEIEVNAKRVPVTFSQIARIISVIDTKEIEAAPVQSIDELLEYIAGVDVRQRGTKGVQSDVSIRGGNFDQTLILLNGVNITDPQTGHHNFNLPVSLSQIDRIEVLEGPAARVYGPNAFSGAINIITKLPGSKSVSLAISIGSFNYFNTNLSASFDTGKLQHLIAVNRKNSKGYVENTDFVISNLFYLNQLQLKKGKFLFQFGESKKDFGANSFYTPKYPNQFEQTKTYFTSAKWESTSKLHFTPAVYWRRHHDKFELFRSNPPDWYKTHNYHLTNVFGAGLNSWFQWKLGKTAFGTEIRSENILSNVLGEELENPVQVSGENAEFTKAKSRTSISGFFEHTYYRENMIFTIGVLGNNISGSNLGWNFFPGLDVSYDFTIVLKVFASYNTSLRMPTFTDLYYSGPSNIGNSDLKPEKSSSVEGGFKLKYEFIQGHFVVFYRKGKDIIDWVKKSNDELWQPQNLTRLNSLGSEIQFQLNLKKYYGNKLPDKIQFSYLYNNVEKENIDFISNYVLDNLKHKFVTSLNQTITKNVSIDLKFVYQDRDGTFTRFENGTWVGEVDYKPFALLDGKILYHNKNLSIYVSINNIFNYSYYDIGNVVQPGRWVKSGISYQIKFN